MKNTCFELAAKAIANSNNFYNKKMMVNNEKISILKEYCLALDNIVEALDGNLVSVLEDNNDNSIIITIKCPELIIETTEDMISELIDRSVEIAFLRCDSDYIYVMFMFPSVYEFVC